MSRSGRAAEAAASASRRVGMNTSSASRMTTKSPLAAAAAMFLAEASPPCGFRRKVMSSWYLRTALTMSSVEPSSQTMTSSGWIVWSRIDWSASPMTSATSYAAMITDIVGCSAGFTGPSGAGARSFGDITFSIVAGLRRAVDEFQPDPGRSAIGEGEPVRAGEARLPCRSDDLRDRDHFRHARVPGCDHDGIRLIRADLHHV